ncbi:hypothetical protein [Flavobacterium sp.]|uniref:hypothetical protein n=1 Tax=Flavobacterium sp. TaxID=239 RepID=UPI003266CFE4
MTQNNTINITHFLILDDGKKALDFYVSAFGPTEKTKHELPDGKLNAELIIGNASFLLVMKSRNLAT